MSKEEAKKKIESIVSPTFRGSYVNLAKPRSVNNSDPRYSILGVFDPGDPFVKKMRRLEEEVAVAKWGKVPKKMKSAIKTDADRDGDEDGNDQFEGKVTVNFTSADAPQCVRKDEDGDLIEVDDTKILYSGAYYRVSTRPYAWDHPTGGKGVSWALNNVLWIKDGKPFSGRKTAIQEFGNLEDDAAGDEEDDDIEDMM